MKQFTIVHFAAGLLSALFLSACNYTNDKASAESSNRFSSQKSGPDFASVQKQIFVTSCNECHAQYANYQSVAREIAQIRTSVLSNRMPRRGPPLSDDLKSLLVQWIDNGAPETLAVQPLPPMNADAPLEPNWASLSTGLIFPKCLVCHNPKGEAKFLDLSNRQRIFENRDRVFSGGAKLIDFSNVEESYLMQILRDNDEPMPPPKSGIDRPTAVELNIVAEWLRRGLP
ncbi:hypothetical protein BH10BDE1_BH10BDE1_09460 [soil metagenome]